MTQRKRFLAVGIVVLAIVGMGVTARPAKSRTWSFDICDDTDVSDVFEMCGWEDPHAECTLEPKEYQEACQAGCVMSMCPNHVSCTGLDSIFCAPCEDMHGARFWETSRRAWSRCEYELHWGHVEVDRSALGACVVSATERECPALAGSGWWRRVPRMARYLSP